MVGSAPILLNSEGNDGSPKTVTPRSYRLETRPPSIASGIYSKFLPRLLAMHEDSSNAGIIRRVQNQAVIIVYNLL